MMALLGILGRLRGKGSQMAFGIGKEELEKGAEARMRPLTALLGLWMMGKPEAQGF